MGIGFQMGHSVRYGMYACSCHFANLFDLTGPEELSMNAYEPAYRYNVILPFYFIIFQFLFCMISIFIYLLEREREIPKLEDSWLVEFCFLLWLKLYLFEHDVSFSSFSCYPISKVKLHELLCFTLTITSSDMKWPWINLLHQSNLTFRNLFETRLVASDGRLVVCFTIHKFFQVWKLPWWNFYMPWLASGR